MKFCLQIRFYFLIAASIQLAKCANILMIYRLPAHSHFNFNQAIIKSLTEAGHNITLYSPLSPSKEIKNLKHVKTVSTAMKMPVKTAKDLFWLQLGLSWINDFYNEDCYNFINSKEGQEILNSTDIKYEVMILQILPMYQCYLPIAKELKIPVIGTSAFRVFQIANTAMGNPNPLVFPFIFKPLPKRMSFYQKLQNVFHRILWALFIDNALNNNLQKFHQKHFPSYNPRSENPVSLLFENNHPSIFSRAMNPTVIEIAGINIEEAKLLPPDIQKFIDEAEHGVILFSLGSWPSSMIFEQNLVPVFIDVFAKLSQRVIWKYDDAISNLPTNVMVSKWLPQRDILAHKNVKAFITHCGIHSLYESIYEAKPMILMPLFLDQLSNGANLAEEEVGVFLDINKLTKEKIMDAITRVLNDKSYNERIQILSRAFKDRPIPPQESVVYWTEHVIRFNGTKHLRAVASDMSLYSYLALDIFLFLLICFFVIYLVIRYVIKKACDFTINYRNKKKTVKKE